MRGILSQCIHCARFKHVAILFVNEKSSLSFCPRQSLPGASSDSLGFATSCDGPVERVKELVRVTKGLETFVDQVLPKGSGTFWSRNKK